MLPLVSAAVAGVAFLLAMPHDENAEFPPPPMETPVMDAPVVAAPAMDVPAMDAPTVPAPYVWDDACRLKPAGHLAKAFTAAARGYASFSACDLATQSWVESRWIVDAESPAGALGIAQFLPNTAAELGVDPLDWRASIHAMARYRQWCERRWTGPDFGGRTHSDITALGLGTYNWGVGNMRKDQSRHGWLLYAEAEPHLPQETRDYVERITGRKP